MSEVVVDVVNVGDVDVDTLVEYVVDVVTDGLVLTDVV